VNDRRSVAQIERHVGESETDVRRGKRLARHPGFIGQSP
jgi:hypothetical protein